MTAENKQIKKESVKKMLLLKEENSIGDFVKKLKDTRLRLDGAIAFIYDIERKQAEKLKLEDELYEKEKLKLLHEQEKAAPETVKEEVKPEKPVKKQEEKTVEKPVESEPVAAGEPVAATPVQPAVEAKKEQKAETRVRKFDGQQEGGRPSFLSANQRPRPTFSNPTVRQFNTGTQGGYQPRPQNQYGQPRPQGTGAPGQQGGFPPRTPGRPFKPTLKPSGFVPAPDINPQKATRTFGDGKKEFVNKTDDKKTMSKRTLIRKGFVEDQSLNEDRMGSRKFKTKKKSAFNQDIAKITKATITTDNLTVKMLSEQIGITVQALIKQFMSLGQIVNINSVISYEDAELVSVEMGVALERNVAKTKEEVLEDTHSNEVDDDKDLVARPPIVTVMGHVDHGKTSLLDALRKTNVADGEAGGITQHIGAYSVSIDGKKITFIDTPGHEAFTAMRARGAKVTDVAIIVVAADDGVMPQTIEAISHAKAADVPIIIAVNKIDKPAADIDRIKQELTKYDIVPEEWGGDSPVIGVSAKFGQNIDVLLKNILMLAELKNLRANPKRHASGIIVEARLDKGMGPVATIIVQNGTLKVGDSVVSGTIFGSIRAMLDDKGRNIKEAGPSMAVSVLGFQEVPEAGNSMHVVSEKLAKQVAQERSDKARNQLVSMNQNITLDEMYSKISEGQLKILNLIVKADVQGSVEALKASLNKLGNDEVRVKTIHGGVGAISKSDVMLAEVSNAIIIGFNVRPDSETKSYAEKSGVEIRLYRIIYEAIDDITDAVKGLVTPKFREQILGHAEVRNIFKVTGSGTIAGCYVLDGKIIRNSKLRVIRENIVVAEGNVDSLKRFKDDVKEVGTNYECGLSIEGYAEYKLGDIIESFSLEKMEV